MTYCNNGVGLAQDAGMFQSLGLGDTSYEAPILTNDIFSKTPTISHVSVQVVLLNSIYILNDFN
jgi:hypothetical protein